MDLRGLALEEALLELERFLDRSFRQGLREVSIIHGSGSGVLRSGTRKKMSELPYVKKFRDAGEGEGGLGVTIALLDH